MTGLHAIRIASTKQTEAGGRLLCACILPAVLLVGFTLPAGANSYLKSAANKAKNEIHSWQLTPKIDVGMGTRYQVYPDGTPTDQIQGKRKARAGWLGASSVLFSQGSSFQPSLWDLKVRGKRIEISFGRFKDGTRTQLGKGQWALFEVLLNRTVVAADLAPDVLARALSGFFKIEGPGLSGGGVQALFRQALHPIEVLPETTQFRSISFPHPPGWQAETQGERVFYRTKGKKAVIIVEGLELEDYEKTAGPELLLTEVLPDRQLAWLQTRQAGLDKISNLRTIGPYAYLYVEGQAGKRYYSWYWIFDTANTALYQFAAGGKRSEAPDLRQTMGIIISTLAPATDSVPQLAASRPEPPNSAPVFSDTPTIGNLSVEVTPARVRRGEQLDMVLRFDILAPNEDAAGVTQIWTLSFDGTTLPTYPTRRGGIERSRGPHEAALQQVIPGDAPLGTYKFKGEVCVLEDCSSRTTTFEVSPL